MNSYQKISLIVKESKCDWCEGTGEIHLLVSDLEPMHCLWCKGKGYAKSYDFLLNELFRCINEK